jgi:hypothetical protein
MLPLSRVDGGFDWPPALRPDTQSFPATGTEYERLTRVIPSAPAIRATRPTARRPPVSHTETSTTSTLTGEGVACPDPPGHP